MAHRGTGSHTSHRRVPTQATHQVSMQKRGLPIIFLTNKLALWASSFDEKLENRPTHQPGSVLNKIWHLCDWLRGSCRPHASRSGSSVIDSQGQTPRFSAWRGQHASRAGSSVEWPASLPASQGSGQHHGGVTSITLR